MENIYKFICGFVCVLGMIWYKYLPDYWWIIPYSITWGIISYFIVMYKEEYKEI